MVRCIAIHSLVVYWMASSGKFFVNSTWIEEMKRNTPYTTAGADDCWDTLATIDVLFLEHAEVPLENACGSDCACGADEFHGQYTSCYRPQHFDQIVPTGLNKNTSLFSMSWAFNITVLLPGSFANLPNLRCLRLICNDDLYYLGAHSFAGLNQLQTLMLQFNGIESLDADAFVGLDQLEHLDLSFNRITRIPIYAFTSLHNSPLMFLQLRNNYLTSMTDQRALVVLKQLIFLDVSDNQLAFMFDCKNSDHELVRVFPNLKIFILSRNTYVIYKSSFCLFDVRELHMEGLRIFTSGNFSKELTNLTILKLSGSQFSHFLNNISSRTYAVDLTQLNTNYPPFVTLNNMASTEILDVSNTEGLILSSKTFVNSINMRQISFGGLHITGSISEIFNMQRNLKILNLARNGIESVNFTFLPHILWTQLEEIDLSHNPFGCDCNIVWFRRWINTTNITLVSINDPSAYICNSPEHNKGKSILSVDINHCYAAPTDSILRNIWIGIFIFVIISSIGSLMHKFRWHVRYWQFKVQVQSQHNQDMMIHHNFVYDAFVIYSNEDSNWIKQYLLPQLEQRTDESLHLCLHERDWLAGALIMENIVESIESSRKCLIIVSNAFTTSNWCNYEMTLVQSRNIMEDCSNNVLVLLEEIAPINMTPRLRLQMQHQTYMEWSEDEVCQKLFWSRLRKALKKPEQSVVHELPPQLAFIELQ